MMLKSSQNQWEKEKSEYLLSKKEVSSLFFLRLLLFFLPTQLAYHFWPSYSYIYGLRVDYLSPTLYVTDILLLLSVISLLTQRAVWSSLIRGIKEHRWLLSSVTLFFIVNSVISVSLPVTLWGIGKIVEMTAFLLLLKYFLKRVRRHDLYIPFILGGVVEGILAIMQFFNQGSIGGYWYFLGERTFTGSTPGIANASLFGHLVLRPYGTLPHPNLLAAYILVCCILLGYFLKEQKNKYYMAVVGILLVFLYSALLLSLSRISIFISGIGVLYLQVTSKTRKLNVAILFFCVGLLLLFSTLLTPRFLALFSDQAVSERIMYLTQALTLIYAHPLFGVGWHAYLPAVGQIAHGSVLQPVHSLLLLLLCELGVVGVGLGMLLVVIYWKKHKVALTNKSGGILLLILFLGTFDHYFLTLQQGQLLLTFLLAHLSLYSVKNK